MNNAAIAALHSRHLTLETNAKHWLERCESAERELEHAKTQLAEIVDAAAQIKAALELLERQ